MKPVRLGLIADLGSLLVLGLAAALLLGRYLQPAPASAEPAATLPPGIEVDFGHVPFAGSKTAPVVILEFSDFQCPYCVRYSQHVLPTVRRELIDTGKVQYGYAHFPLESHPLAPMLALATICADRHGRFWEMHDRIFASKPMFESDIAPMVAASGLDAAAHASCMRDPVTRTQMDKDRGVASLLDISATPSFVVGRRDGTGAVRWVTRLRGIQSASTLRQHAADVERGDSR